MFERGKVYKSSSTGERYLYEGEVVSGVHSWIHLEDVALRLTDSESVCMVPDSYDGKTPEIGDGVTEIVA